VVAPTINLVVFLQAIFDFIILAFVTFTAVRRFNRSKKEAPLMRQNFPRYDDKKTHTIDEPHN